MNLIENLQAIIGRKLKKLTTKIRAKLVESLNLIFTMAVSRQTAEVRFEPCQLALSSSEALTRTGLVPPSYKYRWQSV